MEAGEKEISIPLRPPTLFPKKDALLQHHDLHQCGQVALLLFTPAPASAGQVLQKPF